MCEQEILRKDCKIVKVITDNEFSFEDMAGLIDVKIGSFYNWLNNAYDIKQSKYKILRSWVNDILY